MFLESTELDIQDTCHLQMASRNVILLAALTEVHVLIRSSFYPPYASHSTSQCLASSNIAKGISV